MGFILSKFRKKKSTLEVLEGIEKEINRISASKKQNLAEQNTLIKYILTYGVVFWLIALGFLYYMYRKAKKSEEYILLVPVAFLIPLLLYLFRKILSWWYHKKIIKDDAKLVKLKDSKAKILDEVMEKETYKVATQILEKFEPSKLSGKPNQGASGTRPLVGARPLGATSGATGMDVRKRPSPQNLNASLNAPPPNQRPTPNLNQTIAAMPSTSSSSTGGRPTGPVQAAAGAQPGQVGLGRTGSGTLPPGIAGPGSGRAGPPLPRPVLPRDRGYLDKFVEYLVGDGPSNRYALICRQCQSHNGMALREEFEYISYRCCYCHYWNPARKQRPVAPRLPNPALLKQDLIDSSEESSRSEKNSAANSRRSSIADSEEVKSSASKPLTQIADLSNPSTQPDTPQQQQQPEQQLLLAAAASDSTADGGDADSESDHIELINKEDIEDPNGDDDAGDQAVLNNHDAHDEVVGDRPESEETKTEIMDVD